MIVQAHKSIPLKEALWEAWAGIVHGATGVFWAGWTWTHAQGSGEQNWPITRQVISEVSALQPFLTGVAVSDVHSNRPDVEVRALQPEGSTQVIVVAIARNGYTGPATIQLAQPKQNKATVLYESRQLNITGGRITDDFHGYEAHVYQYTSRVPGRAATDAPEVAAGAAPFSLAAFPNPSSGRTTARFALAQPATVLFRVYDAAGRRVAALGRSNHGAGPGEIVWSGRNDEGRDVAPGVYFIRGTTSRGEEASTRVLIRR